MFKTCGYLPGSLWLSPNYSTADACFAQAEASSELLSSSFAFVFRNFIDRVFSTFSLYIRTFPHFTQALLQKINLLN